MTEALRARLDARIAVAMANRGPQVLAEGQARIASGEHVDEVFADVDGEWMTFRWAGFVVLSLQRGSLAEREPDA